MAFFSRLSRVFSRRANKRSIALIGVPSLVLLALIVGVTITLILLIQSITLQVESGARIVDYNFADQSRVFGQLQRETLKMVIVLTTSETAADPEAVNLQYSLLQSRIYQMGVSIVEGISPEEIYTNTTLLNEKWASIAPNMNTLVKDLNNTELRGQIISDLRDLEVLANSTEIAYNRIRVVTLTNFADASRQIPQMFAVVTIILLAVMVIVLVGLYVYIREVQSAEAARQSSQFKDQFLAVMSHELRTPLNAMIGFLGIIRMSGGLPEKTAYMVDRVRDNAERLLVLINDILDLSKIEAQRFELHYEWIEIQELAARWKTQNDVLAHQKNLKFTLNVDPQLPSRLYIDDHALTKIVTNLLSNAFKFTKEGEVSLSLRPVKEGWEIRVTDTGIGIPEDKQNLVFESFQQVDSSTRRSYGGTGLGLSIVRSLTYLMHGSIGLKSQYGAGSTFTITLPILDTPPSA